MICVKVTDKISKNYSCTFTIVKNLLGIHIHQSIRIFKMLLNLEQT